MTRNACCVLSLATTVLLSACATDDSLPSRPRTAGPLEPSQKAQDNAAQRTMEKPARELPTSGREFPGQSMAPTTAGPTVVTLDVSPATAAAKPVNPVSDWIHHNPVSNWISQVYAQYKIEGFSGPHGWKAFGHTTGPTTVYNRDHYVGPLPHLPQNPGTVPMVGSTPAPDGDWTIDNSWGQGLVIENAPHRAWPQTTVYYKDAPVYHNPTYYFNLQEHEKVTQNPGTVKGDWISNAYEAPWFFVNTALLPLFMALEPPLAQRVTLRTSQDPTYLGHLPAAGETVPAPYAGQLKWTYPFLNPDGTVKRPESASRPNP